MRKFLKSREIPIVKSSMQEKILFDSQEYRLNGILHLPAEKQPPVVIGSHGLMSSGDSPKQIALAERCNANGMAYFRFDHRGCGKSSGDFSSATTFEGRCTDLMLAIKTVLDHPEIGNQFALFGSSFGGAVCLAVSCRCKPSSIITVAAPVRLDSINDSPDLFSSADRSRLQSLTKDRLHFNIEDQLSGISNILIFHGEKDNVVPLKNAHEIYQKAKAPKKLILQKDGDHTISDPAHQQSFIDLAANWFKRGFQVI